MFNVFFFRLFSFVVFLYEILPFQFFFFFSEIFFFFCKLWIFALSHLAIKKIYHECCTNIIFGFGRNVILGCCTNIILRCCTNILLDAMINQASACRPPSCSRGGQIQNLGDPENHGFFRTKYRYQSERLLKKYQTRFILLIIKIVAGTILNHFHPLPYF